MRFFAVVLALLPGCVLTRGDLRPSEVSDDVGEQPDAFRPGRDTGREVDDTGRVADVDAFVPGQVDAFSPDAFTAPDAFNCARVPETCNARDDNCDLQVDEGACGGCEASVYDGSVYLVCRGMRDWDDARAACTAFGSGYDLAVLSSDMESSFAQSTAGAEVWVGLSDDPARVRSASEGNFFWLDGTRGEVSINGDLRENCAVLRQSGALLGDRDCLLTYPYLCEARVR